MKSVGLFLLILCASCVTQKRCQEKFPIQSDTLVVRDTSLVSVLVPGATVLDTIRIDSLIYKGYPVVKVDTSDRAALRYWKDAHGNLVVECEAREDSARAECISTSKIVYQQRPVSNKLKAKWIATGCVCSLAVLGLSMLFGFGRSRHQNR